MYIYYDENNYIFGYGSEPQNNYFEVDSVPEEVDKYLGCYKIKIVENKVEYYPDKKRIAWMDQQWSSELELNELENWFKWYDEQTVQYQRAQRLGTIFNRNIEELDKQAVANAKRITEIRTAMNTPYTEQGGEGSE
jgi:hypothetical protein